MAKKKIQPRRVPRAAEPRMYGDGKPSTQASERTPATPTTTATRPMAAASRTVANPVRTPVTTTQDYAYVLKDLRRLGVLAAATFVLLMALGLFIR